MKFARECKYDTIRLQKKKKSTVQRKTFLLVEYFIY